MESVRAAGSEHRRGQKTDQGCRAGIKRATDQNRQFGAFKGSYTLDDLISIRMDAYTRQYDALQRSHEDGSRDIYISDGIDENGKLQYHKVSQEEDVAFLNDAFDRIADSLGFTAKSKEIKWKINEQFGGQKAPDLSLFSNISPMPFR